MGTSADEITDLFLARIRDYRLDSIYTTSGSLILITYAEPWLLDAITEFSPISNQTLDYTATSGSVVGSFSLTLNLENKLILSRLMVRYWLAKTINDIVQMSNHVTDRDYKTFSSAQNLREKQNYYNSILEELDLLLTKYAYRGNNWNNWYNQIFDENYSPIV